MEEQLIINAILEIYKLTTQELISARERGLRMFFLSITFLGSVIAFMGFTKIFDFGLVGCFILIGFLYSFMDLSSSMTVLPRYLFDLENKLKDYGIQLPHGGLMHKMLNSCFEENIIEHNGKVLGILSRQRIRIDPIIVIYFILYTFFNLVSFLANGENYLFVGNLSNHMRYILVGIMEIFGIIIPFVTFSLVIKKIEIERIMVWVF